MKLRFSLSGKRAEASFERVRVALTRAVPRGKVLEEYSPDNYATVYICVEPTPPSILKYIVDYPHLPSESLVDAQRIIDEKLAYIAKLEELNDPARFKELMDKVGILDDRLRYIVEREVIGFRKIHPLMCDDNLEVVICDGPDMPIMVTHRRYGRMQTNITFNREELDDMIRLLAYMGGRSISRYRPQLSVMLKSGDRAALTLAEGEVARTSSFVVRKFPHKPWTPPSYLATGVLNSEAMALLWLGARYKLSILSFGGLGTGKTTLVNMVAMCLPPDSRIGIAGDIPEMDVPHPGKVLMYERIPSGTGMDGAVTLMDLVAHLLRYDCDYVTINEIRGKEAQVFAQALGVGQGGLASIHAESPRALFGRLKGLGVEISLARELKLLTHMGLFAARTETGTIRRLRRVKAIYLVKDISEDFEPKVEALATYNLKEDNIKIENINPLIEETSERSLLDKEELKTKLKLMSYFLKNTTTLHEIYRDPTAWLELLKNFYTEPEATVEKLARQAEGATRAREVYREVVEISEEGKCPQCGSVLFKGLAKTVCLKCDYQAP